MTNKPIDGLAASFLIIFSVLLGLNQVLVKLVNIGMHPIFQVAMRSVLAIIPILIYCYLTKKKINFFDGSFLPGIITGVLFGVEFVFLFTALDYSTVTRVSLIFYTMPVWLTLSAHFLIKNDTLNLNKILGLIIATTGLVFAVYQPISGYSMKQFYGEFFFNFSSYGNKRLFTHLKQTIKRMESQHKEEERLK